MNTPPSCLSAVELELAGLRSEISKLEEQLFLERRSWKRIRIDIDISPSQGGVFVMWHTADGFEVLERPTFQISPGQRLKRHIRRPAGELDRSGSAADFLKSLRFYELRDVDEIRCCHGGRGSSIYHYHEIISNHSSSQQ